MKSLRKTSFSIATIIAMAMLYFGCSADTQSMNFPGNKEYHITWVTLTGKVFNGLNRTQVTPTTNTDLAGTLTYADPNTGVLTNVKARFDSTSGMFSFFPIPSSTAYSVEFSAGDSFQNFVNENPTGINNSAITGTIFDNAEVLMSNVYLFPTGKNPGDVIITVYDASNGNVISATGKVVVKQGIGSFGSLDNSGTGLTNNYLDRVVKIESDLAAGIATIKGTDLVLGASYTVEVYGVAGYQVRTSAPADFNANTTDASTVRIALTDNETALTVLARSDYSTLGTSVQTSGSNVITITFNKDIELDPQSKNNALASSLFGTISDDDGDGIGSGTTDWATTLGCAMGSNDAGCDGYGSGTYAAPWQGPKESKRVSLSVTGAVLTITVNVSTTTINNYDADDNLTVGLNLGNIAVRKKGSTVGFTALTTLLSTTNWNSGNIIVKKATNY